MESVFFLGSMGSETLEIGQVVLPYEVDDRAGIVAIDSPHHPVVEVDAESIDSIERVLKDSGISFVKGKTASVPAVLHSIKSIKDYISRRKDILGVELELSTFHHFGRKLGLRTYGLLYVWDNPKHDILSGPLEVWRTRMRTLDLITQTALAVLG
ncbi:MAG: hypothetical protein JRM99_08390 [Nitrososphaerota archaeon]|nr:hypothetical protein [Nitrososphaerota archaeon]